MESYKIKQFYVQILCIHHSDKAAYRFIENRFIETGFLEVHPNFVVYKDEDSNKFEIFNSFRDFKLEFVFELKDFRKYVNLFELKE